MRAGFREREGIAGGAELVTVNLQALSEDEHEQAHETGLEEVASPWRRAAVAGPERQQAKGSQSKAQRYDAPAQKIWTDDLVGRVNPRPEEVHEQQNN